MSLTTNHLERVIERLRYAASGAGSIGQGEYTRVHRKDITDILPVLEDALNAEHVTADVKPNLDSLI